MNECFVFDGVTIPGTYTECLNLYKLNSYYFNKYLEAAKRVYISSKKDFETTGDKKAHEMNKKNISAWLKSALRCSRVCFLSAFYCGLLLKVEAKEQKINELKNFIRSQNKKYVEILKKSCSHPSKEHVSLISERILSGKYKHDAIKNAFEALEILSRCKDLTNKEKISLSIDVIEDKKTLSYVKNLIPVRRMMFEESQKSYSESFQRLFKMK